MSRKKRNFNTNDTETTPEVETEVVETDVVETEETAEEPTTEEVEKIDTDLVMSVPEEVLDEYASNEPVVEETVPEPVVEEVKEEAPVSPVYTPMSWVAGKTEKKPVISVQAPKVASYKGANNVVITYGSTTSQFEANNLAKRVVTQGGVKDVYIVKNGPLYEVQSSAPSRESGIEIIKQVRRRGGFAELG